MKSRSYFNECFFGKTEASKTNGFEAIPGRAHIPGNGDMGHEERRV
jgi:hypothetical protein